MSNKPYRPRNLTPFLLSILLPLLLAAPAIAENAAPLDGDLFAPAIETAGSMPRLHSLLVSHPTEDPFAVVRDAVVRSGASIRSLGSRSQSLEDLFLDDPTHSEEAS